MKTRFTLKEISEERMELETRGHKHRHLIIQLLKDCNKCQHSFEAKMLVKQRAYEQNLSEDVIILCMRLIKQHEDLQSNVTGIYS